MKKSISYCKCDPESKHISNSNSIRTNMHARMHVLQVRTQTHHLIQNLRMQSPTAFAPILKIPLKPTLIKLCNTTSIPINLNPDHLSTCHGCSQLTQDHTSTRPNVQHDIIFRNTRIMIQTLCTLFQHDTNPLRPQCVMLRFILLGFIVIATLQRMIGLGYQRGSIHILQ